MDQPILCLTYASTRFAAHLGDEASAHSHITHMGRGTGAIDDAGISNDQIMHVAVSSGVFLQFSMNCFCPGPAI
jgi:hypothetical protein